MTLSEIARKFYIDDVLFNICGSYRFEDSYKNREEFIQLLVGLINKELSMGDWMRDIDAEAKDFVVNKMFKYHTLPTGAVLQIAVSRVSVLIHAIHDHYELKYIYGGLQDEVRRLINENR